MRPRSVTALLSRPVVAFALAALAGLLALVWSGAVDRRPDAFTLQEAHTGLLPDMTPGQISCQGPISVQAPFAAVQPRFGIGGAAYATVRVTVLDSATHGLIASGQRAAPGGIGATDISLNRTVGPGSPPVTLCFKNEGPGNAALLGGPVQDAGLVLTVAGQKTADEAALVFLKRHAPTLLSEIPTMFRRAALFRPGWVGIWTYWVLLVAVLGMFWVAMVALARAAREDAVAGGA